MKPHRDTYLLAMRNAMTEPRLYNEIECLLAYRANGETEQAAAALDNVFNVLKRLVEEDFEDLTFNPATIAHR